MTSVYFETGSLTRGHGLLEGFLARQRAALADRLIPCPVRRGWILDIGCGCTPYFLARTEFAMKVGLDRVADEHRTTGAGRPASVCLLDFDLNGGNRLPFPSGSFNAVTLLAVFEHVRVDRLTALLDEIERVLRPGGVFILTTPAGWTGPVLTCLKWLRMVSPVEIDEHQDAYTRAKIRRVLRQTRLADHPTRFGSFEALLNTWAMITKVAGD